MNWCKEFPQTSSELAETARREAEWSPTGRQGVEGDFIYLFFFFWKISRKTAVCVWQSLAVSSSQSNRSHPNSLLHPVLVIGGVILTPPFLIILKMILKKLLYIALQVVVFSTFKITIIFTLSERKKYINGYFGIDLG